MKDGHVKAGTCSERERDLSTAHENVSARLMVLCTCSEHERDYGYMSIMPSKRLIQTVCTLSTAHENVSARLRGGERPRGEL